MATLTPNLKLILPSYSDKADISVLNSNFQKIDEYCANVGVSNKELQDAVKEVNAWANATASAESVSADNEAEVELTDTENSKNLHFRIPRGQPGKQGPPGPAGSADLEDVQRPENAGRLLYIGSDGKITPLTLGVGLTIIGDVLTITSTAVVAAICGRAVCGNAICGG